MLNLRRLGVAVVAMVACLVGGWPAATTEARQTGMERPVDSKRPGRPPADAEPFAFGTGAARGSRWRPASSSGAYLADWVRALQAHQPGEADQPERIVSLWNVNQLTDAVNAIETHNLDSLLRHGIATSPQRADAVKRAILLHTDIGFLGMPDGRADAVTYYPNASLHFGVALNLVEWLRTQEKNETGFVHTWYRMLAASQVARREIRSTPIFMEWAVERFPDDAEMLLLAGAVHEHLASPWVQEGPDLRDVDKCGTADDNLDAAEYFYRRALRRTASLVEARIRLGRVLGQRGRHKESLTELRRAAGESPSAALAYYLHLFVGNEEEALGHPAAARDGYQQAIALRPEAGFAYLALSRLERTTGSRAAATDSVQRMLQTSVPPEAADELWAEYYTAGEAQHARVLLAEFRESFRRR